MRLTEGQGQWIICCDQSRAEFWSYDALGHIGILPYGSVWVSIAYFLASPSRPQPTESGFNVGSPYSLRTNSYWHFKTMKWSEFLRKTDPLRPVRDLLDSNDSSCYSSDCKSQKFHISALAGNSVICIVPACFAASVTRPSCSRLPSDLMRSSAT